jgi:hypothetical protein
MQKRLRGFAPSATVAPSVSSQSRQGGLRPCPRKPAFRKFHRSGRGSSRNEDQPWGDDGFGDRRRSFSGRDDVSRSTADSERGRGW